MPRLELRLTPRGDLLLETAEDAPILDDKVAARLAEAFGRGAGRGLLRLGAGEVGQSLPPTFVWWRDFAARHVAAVCLFASGADPEEPSAAVLPTVPPPTESEIATLLLTAPMMTGAEYLNADVLLALWTEIGGAFADALAAAGTDLQTLLKALNPAWNLVGRVHFNLAENRRDPELPFAFMATYTTRLSAQAKAQHVPLGQALREYAGAANRDRLLSLLVPVQRAAETLRLAQVDGRCGGNLPPVALEPGRGRAVPDQRARPGKRRRGRAHARDLARQPSAAPAGHGDGRRAPAVRNRASTVCSISTWT